MYQDQDDDDINDIIITMSDADKMSVFLPAIKERSSDLDEYHQMLVGFINAETGKSLETIEDFGHLELLQELRPELRKFNTKMNCRTTNFGTRIDYILINKALTNLLKDSDIR